MPNSILECRAITKEFPGVRALDRIDLEVHEGEVLAVIGENGAGKTTLMKILAGVHQQDAGSILMEGEQIAIRSVRDAMSLGIALIHQELNLADNLSIAANIFLGREPKRLGFIRNRALRHDAGTFMQMVGLDESPLALVSSLSIGGQQLVEIAKALSAHARVIIMDEPTSSLSEREARRLFEVIRTLRDRGVTVIYISHRLAEVKAIADRVVVLRDGRHAGSLAKDEINHDSMVRLMVGRDLSSFFSRSLHEPGDVRLQVQDLRTAAFPEHSVSFSLRAGEIVAVAGLVGAGRTELFRTLFGIDARVSGTLRVDGKAHSVAHPRDAINAGLALVPEDRKTQGLIPAMTVRHNIGLPSIHVRKRAGAFLSETQEADVTRKAVSQLGVRTPGDRQPVQFLSGGNQQKVVLGKWLALKPRVLLLDEPTRGVDVGAKHEIYSIMDTLAGRGVAILFVSSELEEVLGMADRVLVMHEGRLAGELPRDEMSEEAMMHLATGGEPADSTEATRPVVR